MSNKKQINGELDQINMSFTLTDDSESIIIGSSDQKNIVYNIDCISDSSLPQANFQQYIQGADNILEQHNISSIQDYSLCQEQKKHHQPQITFGKGLPTTNELNQQQLLMNCNSNKSQFKNYKQYIVSKEKIQDDQKQTAKKPSGNSNNMINNGNSENQGQQTSQKTNSSVTIIGNSKSERMQNRGVNQNQVMVSNNIIMNNNSQSNLRSSTTHDETQSTNMMTCLIEKTQTETVEFLKKQLIISQSENERLKNKIKEKDEAIQDIKKNLSGLREGITIRDYEQTISKQAIELIQLRQTTEQLQKENKQLQQEIVKNKAESFQKYEDLKQNNEELLEVYEEKFQCQLQLIKDNYIKQISSLEVQYQQDQKIIHNLQLQNENSLTRIQQLEKENQKIILEKQQQEEQNEKYSAITRFLDAQQMQYIYNISKNLTPQNLMFINNNQNYNNLNNNSQNNNNIIANISNNFNNQQVNLQQNSSANSNLINDLSKIIQQQSINNQIDQQFIHNNDQNIQQQSSENLIQNQLLNKSKILSPRVVEQSPDGNRRNQNNLNKSAIKQARQLQTPQHQYEDKEQKINNISQQVKNNTQDIVSEVSNEEKSDDQSSQGQDNSFITKSQKNQQKQFQIEIGQAQIAQLQQQYSLSTQITKRNHYLQQNISHRHYPSQINSNHNLSHNKSCERYGSPLSHREYTQQNKQSGLNQSQTQQQIQSNHNISASKQIQKKPSTKNLNSSNSGILDTQLFQHEIIKGYLSPQSTGGAQSSHLKQREQDNKNANKHIQAKKKKGLNSQEQRSFYNTINTSINSNSLLIPTINKTTTNINEAHSNINRIVQNKSTSKLKYNQTENSVQNQLSDSISHDKLQQVLDEQKNILNSSSIKNLQKMTKSLSNQQLAFPQTNIQIQNMSKLNIGGLLAQQQRGILQNHSQSQQSIDNQDALSPRIHTSRSTNANKNNQTIISSSKIQDKHMISQQSDIIMESPDYQRQERSTSNSTFKPSLSELEDINMKLYKSPPSTNNPSSFQPQIPKQNKLNPQVNKANIYSKIKNQILQQLQQSTDFTNNSNSPQI